MSQILGKFAKIKNHQNHQLLQRSQNITKIKNDKIKFGIKSKISRTRTFDWIFCDTWRLLDVCC